MANQDFSMNTGQKEQSRTMRNLGENGLNEQPTQVDTTIPAYSTAVRQPSPMEVIPEPDRQHSEQPLGEGTYLMGDGHQGSGGK